MNLDKYGLPVQANGDANDQLQRVGMIAAASFLPGYEPNTLPPDLARNCRKALSAIEGGLQKEPGIYSRYIGGDISTVSADQLISALAAHVAANNRKQVWLMFKACIKRFGFAQNTKDGLNGEAKTKMPDFMLIRALPLFVRWLPAWAGYPLSWLADTLLVLLALSACGPVWKDGGGFKSRDPGDVDDNNTILSLAVCRTRYPTPLSMLACFLYAKMRPHNFGCDMNMDSGSVVVGANYCRPALGALRWYHRAEAGGNPEIAELYKPICERYFS